MTTTLVYNTNVLANYLDSTIHQGFYSLNDLHDVDGSGAQPYYFDTLCSANGGSGVYSSFRVLWSKVCVEFNNITEDANPPTVGLVVGVGLDSVSSSGSGLELLMQRPGSKFAPLNVRTGSNNQRAIKAFVSHRDLLGVKDMKDADDQVGKYNTAPSGSSVECMVAVSPTDFSDSTSRFCRYRLRIEYQVEFFDLNTVSQS